MQEVLAAVGLAALFGLGGFLTWKILPDPKRNLPHRQPKPPRESDDARTRRELADGELFKLLERRTPYR